MATLSPLRGSGTPARRKEGEGLRCYAHRAVTDFTKIDKYEVAEEIGKGSFGVVYLGRDPFLKREVAIKVCTVEDEEFRKRFLREAEIAGKLQHPNIVTGFAFGFEDESPYLVQEYLTGKDLRHVINERQELPVADKVDILRQIADGLGHAHAEGVVHRDIKPANVRLLEDGTVKIMDFGIAKLAGAETKLTEAGVTMGTATYLSPEQVRGGLVDGRTDIFSLGVLAYELLTYRRPFEGNTLSALIYQILYKPPVAIYQVWTECPEELAEVVRRCLEKDPERRYRDTDELTADLDQVLRQLAAPAPSSPSPSSAAPGPDDTQPVAVIQAFDDDEPEAEPSPPEAEVEPPPTQPLQQVEPEFTDVAREIGELIAQGDLESARRQIDAIQAQREGTQATPSPVIEDLPLETTPPPPTAAAPPPSAAALPADAAPSSDSSQPATSGPAGGLPARVREWTQALPPAVRRWALPAVAGFVVLLLLVLWLTSRESEPPVAQVAPPPPPPPVAPPPPPEPEIGAIAVHALPWARITEITDADGFVQDLPQLFHTPVLLRLPPGTYRISLENPEHPDLLNCEVEVTVDQLASCSVTFGEATALTYFKETGWWN